MKKLLIISSLITSLAISSANAKTEGSYLGVDLLRTKTHVKSYPADSDYDYLNSKTTDSQIGFGLNYKYAINMNNFFIAPGAFYESINTENKVNDVYSGVNNYYRQTVKIKNRYGIKLDLGYDIMDKFAIYAPIGFSSSNYDLSTDDSVGSNYLRTKTTGRDTSIFYGIGFAFYPIEKLAINLEYNRTELDLKSGVDVALYGNTSLKNKVNLDIIKLGVSYKF